MPPKWSLGYHQCRWSYDSSEKVLKVFLVRVYFIFHMHCFSVDKTRKQQFVPLVRRSLLEANSVNI